jgi:hypothetical protein
MTSMRRREEFDEGAIEDFQVLADDWFYKWIKLAGHDETKQLMSIFITLSLSPSRKGRLTSQPRRGEGEKFGSGYILSTRKVRCDSTNVSHGLSCCFLVTLNSQIVQA